MVALETYLKLDSNLSNAEVTHRFISTRTILHTMSTRGGLMLCFAFKINHDGAAQVWKQTFELLVKGKTNDGYAWGYNYRFSLHNRNVNPWSDNELPNLDVMYRRTHSWQMPSYQYWWDPDSGGNAEERNRQIPYLNYYSKRVVGRGGDVLEKAEYLICQSYDKVFDSSPRAAIIDYSLNNDQWYVFDMHFATDADTHFGINGFRPRVAYANFPARDLGIVFPQVDVGEVTNEITTELRVVSAPRVDGNKNISIGLTNLWLGPVDLSDSNRLGLISSLYNQETGKPQNMGNGTVTLPDGKEAAPLVYLTWADGFTNAADGAELNVIGGAGAGSRSIITDPSMSTVIKPTVDKPSVPGDPERIQQLIHRCQRVSFSETGDRWTYDDWGVPRDGWDKDINLILDDGKDDWSALFANFFAAGFFRLTVQIRASGRPQDYIWYMVGLSWNDNFKGMEVHIARRTAAGAIQRSMHAIENWFSPIPVLRRYSIYMRSDGHYALAVDDNLIGVATNPIESYVFPLFDGLNVATIEMSERITPFSTVQEDKHFKKYSSRAVYPWVASQTKMDERSDINWGAPHLLHSSFVEPGTAKFLLDPGMDGSKYFGFKPNLFCHPANGLATFANAARNELALGAGYNISDYRDPYDLTISPFIEQHPSLFIGMGFIED